MDRCVAAVSRGLDCGHCVGLRDYSFGAGPVIESSVVGESEEVRDRSIDRSIRTGVLCVNFSRGALLRVETDLWLGRVLSFFALPNPNRREADCRSIQGSSFGEISFALHLESAGIVALSEVDLRGGE